MLDERSKLDIIITLTNAVVVDVHVLLDVANSDAIGN